MRLLFEHKNHKILVMRGVAFAQVDVDGSTIAVKNGFVSIHLSDFDLEGKVENFDKTEDNVRIHFNIGFFGDKISLYYNDSLIETKKVSI